MKLMKGLRDEAMDKQESFVFVQTGLREFENTPALFLPQFLRLHVDEVDYQADLVNDIAENFRQNALNGLENKQMTKWESLLNKKNRKEALKRKQKIEINMSIIK